MNKTGRARNLSPRTPTQLYERLGRPSVLEACNVWPHVYDAAVSTGAKVTLAHPYKVRVISEASLESDKVDSLALAQRLRLKAVPAAFAPEAPIRELRLIIRDRAFYLEQERSVKNHVYAALLDPFPSCTRVIITRTWLSAPFIWPNTRHSGRMQTWRS